MPKMIQSGAHQSGSSLSRIAGKDHSQPREGKK